MAQSKTESSSWITMKPAELESIVVDLHNQGETLAKIGLILRDKHGVPKAKLLGKKIKKILSEKKSNIKSEKEFLNEKIKTLENHRQVHKKDHSAQRSLTKKLWVLNKL